MLSGIQPGYAASKDGGKVLYRAKDAFGIVETAEGKKPGDGKIATEELLAIVDPRLEWMQMFNEAWRLERDFYYDPDMGGLDWKAVGEQLPAARPVRRAPRRPELHPRRADRRAVDLARVRRRRRLPGGAAHVDVGLLGADYELDAGSGLLPVQDRSTAERDWNSSTAAPLGRARHRRPRRGLPARRQRRAAQGARATSTPRSRGRPGSRRGSRSARRRTTTTPRTYIVKPVANESVAALRRVGQRESREGREGHRRAHRLHPRAGHRDRRHAEFTRQYYPQVDKDGIIVDERWNGGGFIPDFFVERLAAHDLGALVDARRRTASRPRARRSTDRSAS